MVQLTFSVVPLIGLEPIRPLRRGILNPLRLPIPPQRHKIVARKMREKMRENFERNWAILPQKLGESPLRLPIPPQRHMFK